MRSFKTKFNFDCLMMFCNARAKKRVRMIEKGSERISKQLDIVKFLRSQMLLDTLVKTQFSPVELFLAKR